MTKLSIDKIFFVVPKLIEQPTWGGDYILRSKKWDKKDNFKNLKIGQSYELFSGSKLRCDISSSLDGSFTGELGYAMEPDKIFYKGDKKKLASINDLAKTDPISFLGKVAFKKHKAQIKILIKYTQAKGNSFQIHVKNDTKKWKAKPESWYFMEPGLITLGAKKGINWKKYKFACIEINRGLESLSKMVLKKKIDLKIAQLESKKLVIKYNPWQYVNLIKTKKDEIIDLSCGALHHSWEEDANNFPQGNIVYELCYDVMDPVSVLRSFDKGKIKSDGTLRRLTIDEYFKYVDKSAALNNPKNHQVKTGVIYKDKNIKIEKLLRTKNYSMDKIILNGDYQGEHTNTEKSFHHLFAKQGNINIFYQNKKALLSEGHSCFIPAAVKNYNFKTKSKKSEILKTYVS